MPTQGLIVEPHNVDELVQALGDSPVYAFRFTKGAFGRFSRRVRRRTIQQMTGSKSRGPQAKSAGDPLYGGQFKRGNHVKGFVVGGDLGTLKAVNKISAILRVHEEGATIPLSAKSAGYMYLSRKTGAAGGGKIFAKMRQVVIPPRLHFQEAWNEEQARGAQEVLAAAERAVRLSMEQRMAVSLSYLNKVLSHG